MLLDFKLGIISRSTIGYFTACTGPREKKDVFTSMQLNFMEIALPKLDCLLEFNETQQMESFKKVDLLEFEERASYQEDEFPI